MSLGQISDMIGGRLSRPDIRGIEILGIAFDSRDICGGELFFALQDKRDGHEFIPNALENGAVAVVASRSIEAEIPHIHVNDTMQALGDLAKEYRKSLDADIYCITGSLGKTTTRRAVSRALSAKFEVAESKRNFNNLIGLPLSILEIEQKHDVAVLELGINLPGEMSRLAGIARPDNAIILNIAPVHLEGLHDLETIAREKFELLKHISPKGKVYLNIDDERLVSQSIIPGDRVVTFGFDPSATYCISGVNSRVEGGLEVIVNDTPIETRLYGRGAGYAVCCAFAVASESGLSASEISDSLENFEGLPDRLYVRRLGDITLISDVYNSSPLAVKSALETLSTLESARKIAVLGSMLELGEREVEFNRNMGASAAVMGIDKVFFYGELSEAAYKGALEKGMKSKDASILNNYSDLENAVLETIRPGDAVLVKGSRAMRLERLTEAILRNYEK